MSQFYARYVPPAVAAAQSGDKDDRNDLKRKNSSKSSPKPKKRKIESDADGAVHVTKKSNKQVIQDISQAPTVEKRLGIGKDTKNGFHNEGKPQDVLKDSPHEARDGNETTPTKHARILEKFGKRKEQETEFLGTDSEPTQASPKQYVHADRARLVNNLEPIPQPEVKLPERPLPSYSTVPEWMRTPIRIKSTIRLKLQELDLGNEILRGLADDGKREALSVQTAVLPMLLGKNVEERPDLCVAAATGSGKTLAYVLPILKSLQGRHNVKLRAVIVVPTRALVKQVVQTLRTFTNRLNLRIGTAEGSQSLVEEQRHLVTEKMIYDPTEYQRQQEAPIDWENFDPVVLLEEASRSDPLADIGHVSTFFSKVDVLVCTPGRLVEHLQSTPGFNLDCVEWFVVDEADRLLNESYHEWLDTVLPALKSQTASTPRDEVLRKMHMSVPERRVTKMLFSATMTSDLSQLMALQLSNPKLVLVEDQSSSTSDTLGIESHASSGNAEYQMPSGLIESAVALKDSENKPLYLIELINGYVRRQANEPEKKNGHNAVTASQASRTGPRAEDDSSSEESETDSDSASGSSLPSDSDDESADDSISSTTSSSDSSSETSTTSSSSSVPDSKAALSQKPRLAPASTKDDTTPRVLIFTKSTESAHRLARLLSILAPRLAPHIETFTRASSGPGASTANLKKTFNKTRTRILQSFTTGRTRILISTDLAGRGLDIPGLEHVINYDIPASALTYVHRVGRTARAGKIGHAWTLVEHKQGKWFWETIGGKVKRGDSSSVGRGGRQIQKVTIAPDMDKWAESYEEALQQLGEDVKGQQP